MLLLEYFHKLNLLIILAYKYNELPDYDPNDYCNSMPAHPLFCYWNHSESLTSIDEEDPPKDNSIFFLETSCDSHRLGQIIVNKRLACAVESAARLHPNRSVYILFTSPGIIKKTYTESYSIIKYLLKFKNVRLLHVDFAKYLEGTPVEELHGVILRRHALNPEHIASDILRWITLWKYGGVYLDADIIVLKSLDDLPRNFAGAEKRPDGRVNVVDCGVIGFTSAGPGHEFAGRCLEDVQRNFSAEVWARNGPAVMTKFAKDVCRTNEIENMFGSDCDGFYVFPHTYFYPVPYNNWSLYYTPDDSDEVMKLVEDSYTIHIWNYMSMKLNITISKNSAYAQLARKFCPGVYHRTGV